MVKNSLRGKLEIRIVIENLQVSVQPLKMASSKVVRVRPESLPRNTSCSVDLSDSSGDEDNTERDQGLEDFDIIKTIGKSFSNLC